MKRLGIIMFVLAIIALGLFAIWKIQDMSPRHHFELGKKACQEEDYEKAIRHFSRVVQLDSHYPYIYLWRGETYYQRQENDRALADFDQHIQLRPSNAVGYRFRAGAHWAKREYDLAVADYTKSIELSPRVAHAYVERGAAYIQQKDYDKALADSDKALEIDAKIADAYVNKGRVYRRKRDYGRAETCFLEALKCDAHDPDAYNNLAWLWATCPMPQFRHGAKAIEYATKANELTSWQAPYCLDTLAAAYAESGQYDEALRWLKKALQHPKAFEPDDLAKDKKALALYEARQPFRDE